MKPVLWLMFFSVASFAQRPTAAQPDWRDELETADNLLESGRDVEAEAKYLALMDHPDFRSTAKMRTAVLCRRGVIAVRFQQYDNAERLLKHCAPTSPVERVRLWNEWANIAAAKGDYARAERFFLDCLALAEKQIIPKKDMQLVRQNLALVYQDTGKYDEAEAILARITVEFAVAGLHMESAGVQANLGVLLAWTHRFGEARAELEQALRTMELHARPDHPQLLSVLTSLAIIDFLEHHYTDAEQRLKRAITIPTPNPAELLGSLAVYAETLRKLGRKRDVRELEKTMATLRAVPAPSSRTISVSDLWKQSIRNKH